jgi:DNA-binding CsgD family transcriptional regulator
MAGIVARRRVPSFVVVDQQLNVILKTSDLDLAELSGEKFSGLGARLQQSLAKKETLIESIGDDTVLRVVPVDSISGHWLAVFVDRVEREGPIAAAKKKYGLTKREAEVLELLVRGRTAAAAAVELRIAKSTTMDHIKGIMRKTGSERRTDLIRKIVSRDDDGVEILRPVRKAVSQGRRAD